MRASPLLTRRSTMLRKALIGIGCTPYSRSAARSLGNAAAKPGTLAIVNARVWTGDDAQPWAQALVIDGRTLALVGKNEDARKAKRRRSSMRADGWSCPDSPTPTCTSSRAVRPRVRATARCAHARRVRRANQGVRGNRARRHVDHRRQLGSQPVGRRVADARVDRRGHAGPSGVDQPARRAHVAREQRRR